MRMWLVDPARMCRQHLLGEHLEMHMFMGSLKKGINLDGYVKNGMLEIDHIIGRHEQLAAEMLKRGYNHNSPIDLEQPKSWLEGHGNIDILANEAELRKRCKECKF